MKNAYGQNLYYGYIKETMPKTYKMVITTLQDADFVYNQSVTQYYYPLSFYKNNPLFRKCENFDDEILKMEMIEIIET